MAEGVVAGLLRRREAFCVIEREHEPVRELRERGIPVVEGDATLEPVLQKAGLSRARAIAALLPSDPDNLSIAMTASGLRPGIRILARSERDRSRANLLRAGARSEDVISPHGAAGASLLETLFHEEGARGIPALDPRIPRGLDLERRTVSDEDPAANRRIEEAPLVPGKRVLVMAIEREGEAPILAPRNSETILPGDTLVLLCGPPNPEAGNQP